MADNIRGLTVEISADATTFNKQMRELRSEAKSSQSELNALQKSLELKFDSATFERAQKVAQQAIDETAKAAETLRARLAFWSKAVTRTRRRIKIANRVGANGITRKTT